MTDAPQSRIAVRPYGRHAALLEVGGGAAARSLAAHVRTVGVEVTDVVVGASTVLLDGLETRLVADRGALEHLLADWDPGTQDPDRGVGTTSGLVELPVVFDGADLEHVAERWATTSDSGVEGADSVGGADGVGGVGGVGGVDAVVARLTALTFVSAFCGFAPGFAYLEGLPAPLGVPRLDTPRTRVPPGSVALAGRWCGVYPSASPGGWRLLGHTDAALWDPARERPALLAPGTRVRFVAQ